MASGLKVLIPSGTQAGKMTLTDITEHSTAEGKLYLCAVQDACSKRIVGYSIGARMTSDLAVDALSNALALRGVAGAIVHSDRLNPPTRPSASGATPFCPVPATSSSEAGAPGYPSPPTSCSSCPFGQYGAPSLM